MKRLLAVLLGLAICLLPLAATAEEWDDLPFDEENPFAFPDEDEEFDIDPSLSFAEDFEVDPFASFLGDDDAGDLYAFAFGEDFPFFFGGDGEIHLPEGAPTDSATGSGSLQATINGENLVLSFDPSPSFSSINNGLVQAAFYTYGDTSGDLYELYLTFPYATRGGETITPEYAMKTGSETSVMLVISNTDKDEYYIASQLNTEVFPRTSSYSLHFDSVSPGADTTAYAGSVTADMVSYSVITGEIGASVHIEDATFSFDIANAAPGEDDENPFADFPTPAPSSSLPPDYRKV